MKEKNYDEKNFKITVNDKSYNVTAYCEEDHCSKFKMEMTANIYLHFVQMKKGTGKWKKM